MHDLRQRSNVLLPSPAVGPVPLVYPRVRLVNFGSYVPAERPTPTMPPPLPRFVSAARHEPPQAAICLKNATGLSALLTVTSSGVRDVGGWEPQQTFWGRVHRSRALRSHLADMLRLEQARRRGICRHLACLGMKEWVSDLELVLIARSRTTRREMIVYQRCWVELRVYCVRCRAARRRGATALSSREGRIWGRPVERLKSYGVEMR